jgi:hypothetical protein
MILLEERIKDILRPSNTMRDGYNVRDEFTKALYLIKDLSEELVELKTLVVNVREITIDEIINEYHKEMIKFFEGQQNNNPLVGKYAHEQDIANHEKMIQALEKQEWTQNET